MSETISPLFSSSMLPILLTMNSSMWKARLIAPRGKKKKKKDYIETYVQSLVFFLPRWNTTQKKKKKVSVTLNLGFNF